VSNNAQSNVTVTFMGVSQNLQDALKSIHAGLAGTGTEATATGEKLTKMSESEARAGKEARNMGEAVRVAADTVGLLGVESGESYIRLQSLRHGVTDFTASMGGLKAGLIGGIGLGAAFGGLSFLRSAVEDSIAGEQATNQLRAALVKVPGAFKDVNDSIDKGATTWARYGIAVGTLRAAVAQGVGAGIKPETIIGQPGKIADLAKALGEDVPTALAEIERGGRGAERVITRLNLSLVEQRRTMQQLANPNMSANDRTQFLLNRVQQTAFAGQGTAATQGAEGKIKALDASLADLKETVGTNLLPVLTDMVSSFTGMIQGANQMLSAVGGLSTFLQATWKPALIGIATIFLGLKISHSALGDFIRSRLLGDVSAASGAFAEEAVEATKASDAIGSIPPVVRTIALFDATGASALKDAYLANIARIPGAVVSGLGVTAQPLTVAAFDATAATAEVNAYESSIKPVQVPVTFDTAGALVEPQATPIRIPVEYDTAQAFSEAQATPLKIPVEYDTAQAFNEAQATPLNVPVTYNTANAFSEATAHPLSVPVTYDTTKAFSEANPRPIKVPVTYDTAKAYSTAPVHPLDVPVTYDYKNAFKEAYAHPLNIPVTYNTTHAFSEANARPIRIPVTYDTSHTLSEATSHPIKIPVEYDPTNALHESNAHPIKIPVEYETPKPFAAGAPIGVKVRPEWVSNAASGLKAGLAAGIGITIADAVFNGSIFKYVKGDTAASHGSGGALTLPDAFKTIPTGTQKVEVVNPGAIAGALGFGANAPHPSGGSSWVSVKGEPTVKVASGQKINIDNWSQMPRLTATTPTGSTVKTAITLPNALDVKAHQAGHWEMALTVDSVLRMGQMIGEIALGSMIGNALAGLVGKIPFGAILAKVKDIFPKGSGPNDSFTGGSAVKGVEALLADARAGASPATSPSNAIHYKGTEHVTSLQDVFNTALKTVQIGAPLGAILYGAFRSGGVIKAAASGMGGMFESAFASVIALISFPLKGFTTTNKPGQHSGPAVAAAFAGAGLDLEILGLGKAIVGKFSDGIKAGWTALTQRISALFNDLINAVIAPINSLLSHIPGTHPIPLAGAHTSSSSPHGGSKGTGFNLASINPAVLHPPAHVTAHHAPVVHHHTAHHQTEHNTMTQTNHFHITESKNPQATGDAVLKALSAAAQRKARHGR